jgi:hypothetical protein
MIVGNSFHLRILWRSLIFLFSSACRSASLFRHSTFDDRSVCPGFIGWEAINHVQKGKQLIS